MNEFHKQVLRRQLIGEVTEAEVYKRLAALQKDEANKAILLKIAEDEMRHAQVIEKILSEKAKPKMLSVFRIVWCARIFGLTFALKMMESGENSASRTYLQVSKVDSILAEIAKDEEAHEKALIDMLNDERLNNMGAIVLGLNDALVELTGALAGFTFALSDSTRIAKTGLITGLAAAMSMAASAFLSARADSQASKSSSDEGDSAQGAGKAALYTGVAYVITVFLLVGPYFIFSNVTIALALMLLIALGIIAFFNFYLSVARETSFKRGFLEMASISTVVALISYCIGYLIS